jgi:NADH:ubiquinone oxidoreductase subunit F (NADH-binding)/NADH:ubiquinone oxidoreductase subunit E
LKVLQKERKTDGVFDQLKELQRKFQYLPADELKRVAEQRGIPYDEIHAIASYYPHFYLKPPAKVVVRVCDDMTCHLRGAPALLGLMQQKFANIHPEELDIKMVSCVGRCDHAPAMVINDRYYDGYTSAEAVNAVNETMVGNAPPGSNYRVKDVELACDPYEGTRPYTALRSYVASGNWQGLLAEIQKAGLRGMGGAGFPTHRKWDTVRTSNAAEKYVVCNADESEPGTIKDRFILTHLPHLVIEGMILAGLCVGAKRGYLYIRHEYQEQEEILKDELARCYREHILGKRLLGTELEYDIKLFVSPGGYICGEETALLEAIEGKRAEPRNKPPFLAQVGLWGFPTIVNNVETLAFATSIAARGADWFNSHGANGVKGLKFVAVTGDVNMPGMWEVPMGTTYEELIYKYAGGIVGGKQLLGFAPSGPSSGYLPANMVNMRMDWDEVAKAGSMVGSGAVVVCADDRCMLDMAFNAVRFFRNESCGKCVPCRVGSQKLVQLLDGWMNGVSQEQDRELVDELCHALKQASICGLGQIIPAPIQSVLKHFRTDVEDHLRNKHCPAGVCFGGTQA